MKTKITQWLITATLISSAALLSPLAQAKTTATDAWARATVAGQSMGGAFMTLTSDRDAKLIGASSPAAQEVQLHTMIMNGERMVMQQVRAIDLPAKTAVALTGQYHLMFIGLKAPLQEGSVIPVTLKIKLTSGYVETVTLKIPVKAISTR